MWKVWKVWKAEMRHDDHNRTGQNEVGTQSNDPQTSRNRTSLNNEAILHPLNNLYLDALTAEQPKIGNVTRQDEEVIFGIL
jgi:hypothetical protein